MRKGADCLSKWVGESERQLRLLFDQVSWLLFILHSIVVYSPVCCCFVYSPVCCLLFVALLFTVYSPVCCCLLFVCCFLLPS